MKLHKKSRRHVSACCQDVSVYYAASDVTTSPSAKFILDVVDCKEKVWASVGLLSGSACLTSCVCACGFESGFRPMPECRSLPRQVRRMA